MYDDRRIILRFRRRVYASARCSESSLVPLVTRFSGPVAAETVEGDYRTIFYPCLVIFAISLMHMHPVIDTPFEEWLQGDRSG